MSKVILVADSGEYGKEMRRFLNKPLTAAAIKRANDCGCDAPADEARAEQVQYDPKRPLRPGDDAKKEDKDDKGKVAAKHNPKRDQESELDEERRLERERKEEGYDKNASYEASYASLNAAMSAHKSSPTPENKAALEAAEKTYSESRRKTLYRKDEASEYIPVEDDAGGFTSEVGRHENEGGGSAGRDEEPKGKADGSR